jgi:hypothetical protein
MLSSKPRRRAVAKENGVLELASYDKRLNAVAVGIPLSPL